MLQIVEYYFSSILYVLQALLFLKCAINKKCSISKIMFIFIVGIAALCNAFVTYYIDGVIKTLLAIFIVVYVYVKIYKMSFLKAIFVSFVFDLALLFILQINKYYILEK